MQYLVAVRQDVIDFLFHACVHALRLNLRLYSQSELPRFRLAVQVRPAPPLIRPQRREGLARI